jgi:glycosyltransferase involved in cell wall biosynthesis
MNKKIVYNFSNIFPHYAKALWLNFLASSEYNMNIGFDTSDKRGIKLVDVNKEINPLYFDRFFRLKNLYIFKNKLIFQFGVIYRCLFTDFDKAIFLGDMKVLSTWISSIICRFRGIEVIFWTHGVYGNENKIKLFVRLIFYRLAHKLIVYEKRSKKLLLNYNFSSEKIYVIFNSLDYSVQTELYNKLLLTNKIETNFFLDNSKPTIIFIGRLTPQKKINQLITAIVNLKSKYNLLIVGDGPERRKLEEMSSSCKDFIYFYGETHNEVEISELIYNSNLCVSPGNVGLTAVHSLSYGTPVLTHNNFNNQMPESEIIKDCFNGGFFKENSVSDLSDKIDIYIKKFSKSDLIKKNCRLYVDKYYNPKKQSLIMSHLIMDKKPEL